MNCQSRESLLALVVGDYEGSGVFQTGCVADFELGVSKVFCGQRVWKPAIRQTWKSALRSESMHEVSIMAEAVRMAVESAQAAGAQRITGLRLRVGMLSGAVPEAMEFAWDVVRQGTMAEGAWLKIEAVQPVGWCAECQDEFECADFYSECPRCHQLSGELRRGRELEIAAVEMESYDNASGTPPTPSLSPSDGERVAEGRVRG